MRGHGEGAAQWPSYSMGRSLPAKRIHAALLQRGHPGSAFLLYALIEGACLKPFFALHMLVDAVALCDSLEHDDLPQARVALHSLVSRDRSQLSSGAGRRCGY